MLWPKPASVIVPIQQAAPVASVVKAGVKPLAPPPLVVPERVTSGEEGNRLSVVVELQQTAPVKVSILGTGSHVVRALYNGPMGAGKWSLYWDGLKDDGSKAPSGTYRIQVESGASRMTKTVNLE
jgi:flagellar hook assembly protein FlgD